MRESIPYYWKSIDWKQLMRDYPPPPYYAETVGRMSRDEMHALQEKRFLARVADAWETPFYRDRWQAAGLAKGDIRSLEDITQIPTFESDDIRKSIQSMPPFGAHHPLDRSDFASVPIKIQTSGGTSGLPKPILFDPVAWEVQAIQGARAYYSQGARPGDILQITMTTSLANAGWLFYAAAHHWLGVVPLTTGSGVVTPSRRHLEIARQFGTNFWAGLGDYQARLAAVARETDFDLHQLPTKFIHGYLGVYDGGVFRKQLQEAWNAPVYDHYGNHEFGGIAHECVHQNGLHVFEDTVYLESLDVETGIPLNYGQIGDLVATSLHRSVPPIIRYNMRDKLILYEPAQCACGVTSIKMSNFLGRTDEMVKLRGQNIYPAACQRAVKSDQRTTGEFLCVTFYEISDSDRRQEMIVRIERKSPDVDAGALRADMEKQLYHDLGARVAVEIVEAGALAEHTLLGSEKKTRRLLDLTKAEESKHPQDEET